MSDAAELLEAVARVERGLDFLWRIVANLPDFGPALRAANTVTPDLAAVEAPALRLLKGDAADAL